jgi:hypothetical protein
MDDKDAKGLVTHGATVSWTTTEGEATGSFLYIGTEGDQTKGLRTLAYVIRHADNKIQQILPHRLTFK